MYSACKSPISANYLTSCHKMAYHIIKILWRQIMFNNNDKFLMKAKTVFFILFIVLAVIALITVIITFIGAGAISGLFSLFTSLAALALYAFIVPLVLSYLVDVKLMRNKMYGIEDKKLNEYWDGYAGIFPVGGATEKKPADTPSAPARSKEEPAEKEEEDK